MSIETYYYFLIVLGGFSLVWSFRLFSWARKPLGDFEYLCFSIIWGTVLVAFYTLVMRNHLDTVNAFFANPFATGITLSAIGAIGGAALGRLYRPFRI